MRFLRPAALCHTAKASESPDLQQAAALGIAVSHRHVQKELWELTEPELLLEVLCTEN